MQVICSEITEYPTVPFKCFNCAHSEPHRAKKHACHGYCKDAGKECHCVQVDINGNVIKFMGAPITYCHKELINEEPLKITLGGPLI